MTTSLWRLARTTSSSIASMSLSTGPSTVSTLPSFPATRISAGLIVARHGPLESAQRYFWVQ